MFAPYSPWLDHQRPPEAICARCYGFSGLVLDGDRFVCRDTVLCALVVDDRRRMRRASRRV